MSDPLTRLTAARFDGPQALYTEAVRLLSERPALPDDLAGLVARLRDNGHSLTQRERAKAAGAIEALAAEVEALTNNGEKMLGMLHAATARETEIRAEAWAAALEQAAEEALMCTSPQWAADLCAKIIRAMITDDARAALDRIKAEAKAEGMREAARICMEFSRQLSFQEEEAVKYCASAILAAIPEVRK